ncbi:hypothetical protein C8R44DRAFT_849456 [Mycena epipterygia]|nr:hypothetical protein C8R44DRAFT_849456 [Mycena epipterygia]
MPKTPYAALTAKKRGSGISLWIAGMLGHDASCRAKFQRSTAPSLTFKRVISEWIPGGPSQGCDQAGKVCKKDYIRSPESSSFTATCIRDLLGCGTFDQP